MTSVWKAIHTIVKHFVVLGYLEWLFPWLPNFCFSLNQYKLLLCGGWLLALILEFSELNVLYLCVFAISTIKIRRKRRISLLSIIYITFETHSLSPTSQNFICSSHLKGVRAILKIIITFWPGSIFPNQSSKSSAALLVPTFFICFYIFNIAEKHINSNKPSRWLVSSSSLPQLGFLFVRIKPL